MGMKDWLEKLKKNAEQKLKDAEDPAIQKAEKKEKSKKLAERTMKMLKLAKKGADAYKDVSEKVDEVTSDVTKKTVELAEKARPIAEKIDEAAGAFGEALGEKVKGVFDSAAEKIDQAKENSAKKPSTGSSILDLLTPIVPETDETMRKPSKEAPPKADKPPSV